MRILQNHKVPTGNILITEGDKGKLECVSLGDYGKEKNLKADFLGLEREIEGVPHGDLLPLSKKWVITISSQYGCSMDCTFCDVPKVGPGFNATFDDLVGQVESGLSLHRDIKYAERINVHYARMGEPSFNPNVVPSAYYLAGMFANMGWGFHPVLSTIVPRSPKAQENILSWLELKNNLGGNAGLQFSINTTDNDVRRRMMPYSSYLEDIADFAKQFESFPLKGRKIALNFALTDAPIDAKYLRSLFNPEKFLVKITPMHLTNACVCNKLTTKDGYTQFYPYKKVEQELKEVGFDVIVFIPSIEEDTSRITCGNAILSDE